jgi:hypothetical protein
MAAVFSGIFLEVELRRGLKYKCQCLCPPNIWGTQSDGLWRLGRWQTIGSWGWGPTDGISALVRSDTDSPLCLIQGHRCQSSEDQEAALTLYQMCWHLDLGLRPPNSKKRMLVV